MPVYTYVVTQDVHYYKGAEFDSPEEVVEWVESGDGWDMKDNEVKDQRVQVYDLAGTLVHDTSTEVTVTVGWTRSDMAKGYSSFDGYRPGADQHTETLSFDVPADYTDEQVCDLVFAASNDPNVPAGGSPQAFALSALLATGYNGQGAHYSLSVGDTVTVRGKQYACANLGWELVER